MAQWGLKMLTHGDLLKLRPCTSDQNLVNCFQRRLYSNTHRFSGLGCFFLLLFFFLYQAQHKHSKLSAKQETVERVLLPTVPPTQHFPYDLVVLPHSALFSVVFEF